MKIGEKIKDLRAAKLMTQKELAGDGITRNMLSQIERGAAVPSLSTVKYLAERLNVPVGFLVSEDDSHTFSYKRYSQYRNIVEAYKSKSYDICRDLCLDCISEGDNELYFILSESTARLAISYFCKGKLKLAAGMLEEYTDFAENTMFPTDFITATIKPYNNFMSSISPLLTTEINMKDDGERFILQDDFSLFEAAYFSEKYNQEEYNWQNQSFGYYLSARALMKKENYSAAETLLLSVIDENALPQPIIYLAICDGEICAKEIGDYKNAYELSNSKIQLFEKMLEM